ncbi:Pkinase-domain-containing protein, partial [Thozetella sp. PMI_491]
SSQLVFHDGSVSRNQLEFFSITIDEDHYPMIYVRDRQSSNGTYVNGNLIGRKPAISPARLLNNGDVIEIFPHITFKLHQPLEKTPRFTLTPLQRAELKLIENVFIVSDRTIGDGCHAVIHLAVEVKTGRQVVCKIHNLMKPENAHPDSLRRIRQEANIMNCLDHPHILAFKQAFESSNNLYIFMELATGGDLFSLLWRRQKFSNFEIKVILRQVLRGVSHLHARGIAHRDLKTENILCAVAPTVAHRIVITDLGHAGMTSRGRMRSNVGTLRYRAPEAHQTSGSHGASVDIWSIGVLTLQLFAGPIPLAKLELGDQALITSSLDAYLLEIYGGEMTENAKGFIRSCLTFDSDQRPTAQEALEHPWLQEPEQESNALGILESASLTSWTQRDLMLPAIENLGGAATLQSTENNDLDAAQDEFRKGSATASRSLSPGVEAPPEEVVVLHSSSPKARVFVKDTGTITKRRRLLSPSPGSSASTKQDHCPGDPETRPSRPGVRPTVQLDRK